MYKKCYSFLLISLVAAVSVLAEPFASKQLSAWDFTSIFTLERRAQNAPGLNDRLATAPMPMFAAVRESSFLWFGETPTDAKYNLLNTGQIPTENFSIELWMLNHVNQPVGTVVGPLDSVSGLMQGWFAGSYDRTFYFGVNGMSDGSDMDVLSIEKRRGFHGWLYHLVGTYDGKHMVLYLNGEKVAESETQQGAVRFSDETSFNAFAFMKNERYMRLGDLVKNVWLYDGVLSNDEIKERFEYVSSTALDGRYLYTKPHFTVGPILQMMKKDQVTLLWETDRPMKAKVQYGRTSGMIKSVDINSANRLQELTLTNLHASTPYFYRVVAIDDDNEIDSGMLTFQTEVNEGEAVTFAVIADTEARPHISDRIAKQIWGQRPHFLLINGDLTDGGQEPNRYEWVYEYFASMTQLFSRVPSYPSIGNGESDMVWYTRFHALPQPENYYTFTYGNIQFFMMDSNRDMSPGSEQYKWLEEQFAKSTSTWKFVAHHHPTYTSDEDDYGDMFKGPSKFGDSNVRDILPLYEENGVDAVWFGHLHSYERTWPIRNNRVDKKNGVMHIQTGGAGGNFEEVGPTRPFFSFSNLREHHYCVVRIHGNHMDFSMLDVDGYLRDHFVLEKE
jgi:acid phosphatase type 7